VTPLVEFGGGTVADCLAALDAAAPGLVGAPLAGLALCLDDLATRPVPPALRCGLEAAALDALGRARGCSIAALFADSPRRRVAVNGTIGGLPAEAAADEARRLVAQGFGTIKLKVGMAGSVAEEAARVAMVREAMDAEWESRATAVRRAPVDGAAGSIRAAAAATTSHVAVERTSDGATGTTSAGAALEARDATAAGANDAATERTRCAAATARDATVRMASARATEPTREASGVAALKSATSRPQLRLDANEAWSVADAQRALEALAGCDVELVEQPIAAEIVGGLARVRRASPIPIAADESVVGLEAARRLIDAGAVDYVVVKPTVVGGITAGRAIADLARPAGVGVIVTTAFEAGLGIAAALHLAATLPENAPACGLATADALASTLVRGLPPVEGGEIALPDAAGLGVAVDEEALQRHSSPRGRGWAEPR